MTQHPSQRVVQTPTLKFAEEHIDPILRRQKTSTIRLQLDDSFQIGHRFQLADENGDRFASAIVKDRGYLSAKWIVRSGIEGHRDYRSVEALLTEMEQYYPDATLDPDTCFPIVHWRELWE